MARPTEKTVRTLFALSGNACAYPECASPIVEDNISVGEICHIRAHHSRGPRYDETQSDTERHAIENLILLCCNHHRIVDAAPKRFTVEALTEMKADHEAKAGRRSASGDAAAGRLLIEAFIQFNIAVNGGSVVVALPNSAVIVRSAREKVHIHPPTDSIGASGDQLRYCEYLIKRYNDYAAYEPTRGRPFHHGIVRRHIEQQFGARLQLLPSAKFHEVCDYLQTKIKRTRIGRLNGAKGKRAYSTFDEYLAGHE